jgi:uncharacterized metal-binding protein
VSSGKTHVQASLFLAAGFSIGAMISWDVNLLKCTAGALVGILLTPDLDVDKTYIGNQIIKKKLGYIPERLWNGFWWGYKKSFKHGQFGSHSPPYGTYTRLLYIFLYLIVPFYILYFLILLFANYHFNLIYELLWWCRILFVSWYTVGLVSSDFIHAALDRLTKNME